MKTQFIVLMSYLVLFGVVTIIGIIDFFRNIELVDLGLPIRITNLIIVFLGVFGLLKSIIYLIFFEKSKKKKNTL